MWFGLSLFRGAHMRLLSVYVRVHAPVRPCSMCVRRWYPLASFKKIFWTDVVSKDHWFNLTSNHPTTGKERGGCSVVNPKGPGGTGKERGGCSVVNPKGPGGTA